MTLEALNANMAAYDPRIHIVRGYPGAQACAENIRRLTAGSELLKRPGKKVQDAYSLRSSPQVIGAAKDAFQSGAGTCWRSNSTTPPTTPFSSRTKILVLTGANFQGTPLAFALELVGMSVTTVDRSLRAQTEPAHESSFVDGAACFPDQRRRNVLGPHALPVHRWSAWFVRTVCSVTRRRPARFQPPPTRKTLSP